MPRAFEWRSCAYGEGTAEGGAVTFGSGMAGPGLAGQGPFGLAATDEHAAAS